MLVQKISHNQWPEVKNIYNEAFPASERKPFFTVKRVAQKGKTEVFTAVEEGQVIGFVILAIQQDLILIDYLAVSNKVRSRGTGGFLIQSIGEHYPDHRIVLLIEKPELSAENAEQRLARKRFYHKHGFEEAGFDIKIGQGLMEVLCLNGKVLPEEYLALQKYTLGNIMFKLAKVEVLMS